MECQQVYESLHLMKHFKFCFYLALSLGSFVAQADFYPVVTEPTQVTADIIPRNPRVGEDESRHLRFYKWISISDETFLGLTKEDEVYGVVKLDKVNEVTGQTVRKTYAYLLSGERRIDEILLDQNKTLWAVNNVGQVLVFDRREWLKTPMMKVLKDFGWSMADDISIFGILFLVSNRIAHAAWDLEPLPTVIIAGMSAVGILISQFLRAANRYGRLNALTDAFVPVDHNISIGPNLKHRFAEAVKSIPLDKEHMNNGDFFDRKCELELLPLPVDHSQWKP